MKHVWRCERKTKKWIVSCQNAINVSSRMFTAFWWYDGIFNTVLEIANFHFFWKKILFSRCLRYRRYSDPSIDTCIGGAAPEVTAICRKNPNWTLNRLEKNENLGFGTTLRSWRILVYLWKESRTSCCILATPSTPTATFTTWTTLFHGYCSQFWGFFTLLPWQMTSIAPIALVKGWNIFFFGCHHWFSILEFSKLTSAESLWMDVGSNPWNWNRHGPAWSRQKPRKWKESPPPWRRDSSQCGIPVIRGSPRLAPCETRTTQRVKVGQRTKGRYECASWSSQDVCWMLNVCDMFGHCDSYWVWNGLPSGSAISHPTIRSYWTKESWKGNKRRLFAMVK